MRFVLRRPLQRLLTNVLKIGASAAILVYLGWRSCDSLREKLHGTTVNWGLISAAALVCLLAVLITFLRWHLLVRALGLPFSLRDAFRLGFLGYLFNFFSLGSVGGDLFRAIFIAREQPGRRAEAVATVVVDRIIGLYALFVVASIAVLSTGLLRHPDATVRLLCRLALILTAVSTVSGLLVLTPGFSDGRLSRAIVRLPRIGPLTQRLLEAVRIYGSQHRTLLWTGLMSLAVHGLSTLTIFLLAQGLCSAAPDIAAHFLIVPLGILAGAIPLLPGGLGALESVLELLYIKVPADLHVAPGTGLLVALAFRGITVAIAVVGFGYYLANRAVVARIMKQAAAGGMLAGDAQVQCDQGSADLRAVAPGG